MLKLHIEDLKIPMFLGIYDFEKKHKTNVILNIIIFFDGENVLKTNNLEFSIDYDILIKQITLELSGKHFDLIESVISKIHNILTDNVKALSGEISVTKLETHTNLKSVTISKTF
jgi:FolB domain-containing protein